MVSHVGRIKGRDTTVPQSVMYISFQVGWPHESLSWCVKSRLATLDLGLVKTREVGEHQCWFLLVPLAATSCDVMKVLGNGCCMEC